MCLRYLIQIVVGLYRGFLQVGFSGVNTAEYKPPTLLVSASICSQLKIKNVNVKKCWWTELKIVQIVNFKFRRLKMESNGD